MRGRKWLASALLAGMVVSPVAFAQVSSLDDEILADVSAQGIQTISNPTQIRDQQNNNDSVQVNGDSQRGSSGMEVVNYADSASNVHQNVANISNSEGVTVTQANDQYAENHGNSDQQITNEDRSRRQNNNNASVQLNDNAQRGISSATVSNAATSAVNVGQNIASVTDSSDIGAQQYNSQVAMNEGVDTQTIENADVAIRQENNNASVQLNDRAQRGSSTMVNNNTAGSAANVAQNIISVDGLRGSSLVQANDQTAINTSNEEIQIVDNNRRNRLQNNNNGAVQVNDRAQSNASGMVISNASSSAKNVAQNVLEAQNMNGLNVIDQSSVQVATNGSLGDGDSQDIQNRRAALQNNNDASVQLNDNAQSGSSAMVLGNSANSAENVAQNVFSVNGNVAVNEISSSNDQAATNRTRFGVDQSVDSTDSLRQKNNANSVQLNDNAQNGVAAMALSNSASAASNIAQNAGDSSQIIGFNLISQSNTQVADNIGVSAQSVSNSSAVQITAHQDNNNGSVQLNDDTTAQNDVAAMALSNSAMSASNVAQNAAAAANVIVGSLIFQSNDQTATNAIASEQTIDNNGLVTATIGQDNNNGSVQVEEGQNRVEAMSLSNSTGSALNVGQNVASGESVAGIDGIVQDNTQVAEASSYNGQTVYNDGVLVSATIDQNNNNGAVQISNGQNDISAASVVNSAASAVNTGQNVGSFDAVAQIGGITQTNDQTASATYDVNMQYVENGSWVVDFAALQDNNNASVQINGGQNGVAAMSMLNSSASASNVAQSIADYNALAQIGAISQENTQLAATTVNGAGQAVINVGVFAAAVTPLQDNNNGSVQLNAGQIGFSGMSLANTGTSAANVGQNVGGMSDAVGITSISQLNDQTAQTVWNGQGQYVLNGSLGATVTVLQDNNNGSVQANAGAQDGVNAMSVANLSASAANVGQNVGAMDSLAQIGLIDQTNTQVAEAELAGTGQLIENYGEVVEVSAAQDNNNGSVQVNGAQNAMDVASFVNAAHSAVNVAQNVLEISDLAGLTGASQTNDQYASSSVTGSGQEIYNYSDVVGSFAIAQDNNNGSVQLNGAQNDVSGLSLANATYSAVNVAQNIATLDNPVGGTALDQANIQTALNEAEAGQYVLNEFAIAQDNNNGSIQVNGAQNNVSAMSVLNATLSSVNVAMNIANINGSDPFGTVLNQSNDQYAENASDALQAIDNAVTLAGQDNNNASVQLNNAQVGTSALMLSNVAASAYNYGLNVASVNGATGWTINQTATQTAINW